MASRSLAGTGLKALLLFVAISHIVVGLAAMGPPGGREKLAAAYGAQVEWTEAFVYILRPLGVFMIALGIIGVAASRDPLRHKAVVVTFALLLLARVAQRIVYAGDIEQAFAIASGRNLMNAAFFFVLAILLLVLLATAVRGTEDAVRHA